MGWDWKKFIGGAIGGAGAAAPYGWPAVLIGGAAGGILGSGVLGGGGGGGKTKTVTTETRQATPITVMIGGKPVTMYSYGPSTRTTTGSEKAPDAGALGALGDILAIGGAWRRMAKETGMTDTASTPQVGGAQVTGPSPKDVVMPITLPRPSSSVPGLVPETYFANLRY